MFLGYCLECGKQMKFIHCNEHDAYECSVCHRISSNEEELKFYEETA